MNEYTLDQIRHLNIINDNLSSSSGTQITTGGQHKTLRVNEGIPLCEKAALFDTLAAMRDIEVTQDKNTWAIWRERDCAVTLLGSGKTLAEAVAKAMKAAPLDVTAQPR